MPFDLELLLRLLLAALLGGLIGAERELNGQPAGLRTHMLLTIGACVFTLVSGYAFGGGDPTRIAAQIVSGVGFLGGGAILRQGLSVRGITTAASIWATCALGVAVGSGMYLVSAGGVVLALATLGLLRPFRNLLQRGGVAREVMVVRTRSEFDLATLMDLADRERVTVRSVDYERQRDGDEITLFVKLPRAYQPERLVAALGKLAGVQAVTWGD